MPHPPPRGPGRADKPPGAAQAANGERSGPLLQLIRPAAGPGADRDTRTLGHRHPSAATSAAYAEGIGTVTATESTDAPIYAQLIRERGDVPEDARRTAEQTQREAGRFLNFRLPPPAGHRD